MPESLTPEQIEKVEFHRTFRGYARDEVREFLVSVSTLMRRLEEKSETAYLNLGEKMGELLQGAKDAADELMADTRTATERLIRDTQASASQTERDASIRAADIIETAESHAAKIVSEAERRVADLQAIEEETRATLSSIRTRLASAMAQLPEEVGDDRTDEIAHPVVPASLGAPDAPEGFDLPS